VSGPDILTKIGTAKYPELAWKTRNYEISYRQYVKSVQKLMFFIIEDIKHVDVDIEKEKVSVAIGLHDIGLDTTITGETLEIICEENYGITAQLLKRISALKEEIALLKNRN
jgi:hypothetical protein